MFPQQQGVRAAGPQFGRAPAPVTLGFDNGYCVEATDGIAMDDDLIALNLGQSATEDERVQLVQQKQQIELPSQRSGVHMASAASRTARTISICGNARPSMNLLIEEQGGLTMRSGARGRSSTAGAP